jgi:hypothetical protein
MLILIPLAILWLLVVVVVIAACRMAARGEQMAMRGELELAQSPRRASTWGAVPSRILTSPHSDQFATYR